jgi:arginyl-tRNA synthetase
MKNKLQKVLCQAAENAMKKGQIPQGELPPVLIEEPPQKDFGDFACNLAMQAARSLKANPRKIAEALIENIQEPWIERIEIAGPGFLNFYLKSGWLQDSLKQILSADGAWGNRVLENPETIQVEFVSANPTGPLHVGHGRGAAIGSALANLLAAGGYKVQKEYYINDAGNQIDNLVLSVNARYLELCGESVEFPEDGYHGQDIVETARRLYEKEGKSLLELLESERLEKFKSLAVAEKLADIKKDLENFGVTFDVWYSEKSLYDTGKVDATYETLKKNDSLYLADGAWWLRSIPYGDDKDRVVIRDNGVPTYLASDIAYHRDKLERGFDKLINIWGADHHGYIPRMSAAIQSLGYRADQMEVIVLQMVNLYQDGQLVKMSKRTGQGVTLAELTEEVGRDAARYFFIMRSADSQLDFDLDLAKSQSKQNPIYYIQYVHARICSIFRNCADAEIVPRPWKEVNCQLLTHEAEEELIRLILRYPEEVAYGADEREPHRICQYIHELSASFHSFYDKCRVIGVEPELQQARLQLVKAVQMTIKHGLEILEINAPERM